MNDDFNKAAGKQKPKPGELVLAVDKSDVAAVKALLDRGADAVAADKLMGNSYGPEIKGLTCLGYAARHGSIDIVQLLLDAGADINFKDRQGFTPLMWAADNCYPQMACFLIGQGASPEEINDRGWTVWEIASDHENMGNTLQVAVEARQRAVAAAAVVAAVEAEAAALHDTASNRQEVLKSHARKFTIKPV